MPTAQWKCSTPSATPRCCSPPTPTPSRSDEDEGEPRGRRPNRCGSRPAHVAPAVAAAPAAAPSGAPRPDDIAFDAADATLALIALSAKMRIDQIEELDSIESITDGASSRRNQLLVDLGSELNLGAIDGAAEADLAGLRSQVTKLARTYKPYGPVLSDAINDQLRTVLGPSGKRPGAIAERVKKTWELGDGWAKHVTVEVALGTREGTSVRGGAMGHLHEGALADAASVDKVIDAAVTSVAARRGISVALPSVRRWRRCDRRRGRAGRIHRSDHRSRRRARLGGPPGAGPAGAGRPGQRVAGGHRCRAHRPGHRRTGRGLATFGGAGVRRQEGRRLRRPLGQRPRGPGQALADRRGRHRRRLGAAVGAVRGRRARRRHSGHLVAGQSTGRGPSDPRIAVRPDRRRCRESRSGSLQQRNRRGDRRFEGFDRGVGGRTTARRRCHRHRDDVEARRRAAGVLPHAVSRPRPLRRRAVGGRRQHGVLLRHRRPGRVDRYTSRPKALGRSRFTSRTRRPRRCCSRSRHRVSSATCPRPVRAPRWR